jgi:hypothetical protein
MATADFFLGLAKSLRDAVGPLTESLGSVEGFSAVLQHYGWQPPSDPSFLPQIQSIFDLSTEIQKVITLADKIISSSEPSPDDLLNLISAAGEIINTLRKIASAPAPTGLPSPLDQPTFWQTFPLDLATDLLARYLEIRHPQIYALLYLFGIIDETTVLAQGAPGRLDYVKTEFVWSNLGTLVSKPTAITQQLYGWGGTFDHDKLLRRLARVLQAFGARPQLHIAHHALLADYYTSSNPALKALRELHVPLFIDDLVDGGYAEIGLLLLPIPPASDTSAAPNGLLIGPYAFGQLAEKIPLGGPFSLRLEGGLASEAPVGLELRPDGVGAHLDTAATSLQVTAALDAQPSSPCIIVGSENSHRVQISDFSLSLDLSGSISSPELKLSISVTELAIIIQFADADGFLGQIFGTNPQKIKADAKLVWSSRTGLSFSGDVGIALVIPLHVKIAIVELDTLYVRLQLSTGGGGLDAIVAITGGASIGPISASVEEIGVKLSLIASPGSQQQNALKFGDLGLTFGFKPPKGLGLSIDAAVVSGGGFVSFDDAKGEYAGFLDIGIAEIIQVTFICILDTKLSNGAKGFSLLFIIFMELPPIQLGFGFTLNGVGGVAGVNRTMSITGLQAGVRNHTLDYVINPPHTVADAPKVIAAVNSFFPIATGRYVFGPILKVGWETFVQLTVGVILEVPDPIRLALLGIFDIALPSIEAPEEAIVKIHIDVLGTLDFGTKKLTIDGSMYDSSILEFPLLGDFALRSSWGANPSSLFVMGGFNPNFNSTGLDVPQLHRLSITIGDGDNPRISANAYLAITSNTIQFGANIEAYVSAGDFSVHGYLGFDVLIVISPPSISFEFDFAASLDVSYKGHSLAGLSVTGVFTGTSPWHIHGEATIHILCFSVSGSVDATWGQSITPAPPPEAVLPDLLPALADPQNWGAALPDGATPVVTLSAPKPSQKTVIVHPMGTLTVREKVVPLDLPITHYKGGTPSDGHLFSISDVQINTSEASTQSIQDYFAAGQFLDLSDADKLSRPSFESHHAGVQIGSTNICSGPDSARNVTYDEYFIVDPNSPSIYSQAYIMPAEVHLALSKQGAAYQSGARNSGLNKYRNGPATPAVLASDPSYVVVSTDDLSIRNDISPSGGATYFQAHAALNKHLATHPQDRGSVEVLPLHEATA